MKRIRKQIKHYLISSILTFGAAFISALIPFIDKIDLTHFEIGAIAGVVLAVLNVALRAGLKALFEGWLQKLTRI